MKRLRRIALGLAIVVAIPYLVGCFALLVRYVPYWGIALTTVLPICCVALFIIHNRNLPGEGRCVACHYDLRATPDRCPECGIPQQIIDPRAWIHAGIKLKNSRRIRHPAKPYVVAAVAAGGGL